MPLNHRLAERKDLAAVYDLYMDKDANRFLTFDLIPLEAFDNIFNAMVGEKNLFVTELEHEIASTFRLIRKNNRQAHILYLGGFTVKTSLHGKGIGAEILKFIHNYAVTHLIKRIELTVDTKNFRAISLYGKMGFEIEGKLKNNYRLSSTGEYYDEYLMALSLD
jgi:putative acetyltransferase